MVVPSLSSSAVTFTCNATTQILRTAFLSTLQRTASHSATESHRNRLLVSCALLACTVMVWQLFKQVFRQLPMAVSMHSPRAADSPHTTLKQLHAKCLSLMLMRLNTLASMLLIKLTLLPLEGSCRVHAFPTSLLQVLRSQCFTSLCLPNDMMLFMGAQGTSASQTFRA